MASITRAEVASLIGEEYGPYVLRSATAGSTALSLYPTVNMGTKVNHLPVLATLPTAGWVGDTTNADVKPTSKATWENRTLVAEEIAVIVPIHENTLDDATEDILQEIAAVGGQAIGKALDEAVFFGTNKPTTWQSPDLLAAATAAGQVVQVSATPGPDDLYGAFIQAGRDLAATGFSVNSLAGTDSIRFDLANLRGSDGHLVLSGDGLTGFGQTAYNANGAWDPAEAVGIVADRNRIRIGIRQDVTVKLLTEATITGLGNLAELDMVALRFKARYAYVLGTGATSRGANQTPVSAVIPAAAGD